MAVVVPQEPEMFRTNFASGEYTRVRVVAVVLYAVVLCGVALAAVLGWWAVDNRREAQELQDHLTMVQQQAARLREDLRRAGFAPDDQAAVNRLAKQVEGLNQILEQKAFSWTGLLNDLEAVVPKNVSLRSIRPDLKTKVMTLDGVALTLQDVTAFMTALESNGRFAEVFLQQQRATEENRTEFTIACVYRGGDG